MAQTPAVTVAKKVLEVAQDAATAAGSAAEWATAARFRAEYAVKVAGTAYDWAVKQSKKTKGGSK